MGGKIEEESEEGLWVKREDSEERSIMRAKEDELRSWKENKVYKEIKKKWEHGLSTRWIRTIKQGEERWKARFVVRSFEEKKIEGRNEASTCSGEGLKMYLSVIKKEWWRVRSIDVKTAYLQGKNID